MSFITFTLRCVQYMVTSVLQDQQYMFGLRSLLVDEKALLMKKDQSYVLFQRLIQRSQQSRLIRSDWHVSISVQINLDNMLKNKS